MLLSLAGKKEYWKLVNEIQDSFEGTEFLQIPWCYML